MVWWLALPVEHQSHLLLVLRSLVPGEVVQFFQHGRDLRCIADSMHGLVVWLVLSVAQ